MDVTEWTQQEADLKWTRNEGESEQISEDCQYNMPSIKKKLERSNKR